MRHGREIAQHGQMRGGLASGIPATDDAKGTAVLEKGRIQRIEVQNVRVHLPIADKHTTAHAKIPQRSLGMASKLRELRRGWGEEA